MTQYGGLAAGGRFCWTLSAFLSTQKSKNTQKSAFESKFTLLSAQKSDQKSGFAKSKKDFPHATLVFEDGKWVEAHKMILAEKKYFVRVRPGRPA